MVVSQIRSFYCDENDLLRTVIKPIYEEWNPALGQWKLKKIKFLFSDDDLPVHTDSPEASIEHRPGWLVPPEWEFISEVWEYERRQESEIRYNHESEVGIIR